MTLLGMKSNILNMRRKSSSDSSNSEVFELRITTKPLKLEPHPG